MEQLEIHSRSYLARWVEVKSDQTISWSVQPHKKSINFGIFKHPGSGTAPTPRVPSYTSEAPAPSSSKHGEGKAADPNDGPSAAVEKLKSVGMTLAHWQGNCEANVVTSGTWDVGKNGAGMYALVFDNTFSKSTAKTVTFVLLTYPTNASSEVRHASHAGVAGSVTSKSKSKARPKMGPEHQTSDDSLPRLNSLTGREGAMDASNAITESSSGANVFTGVLQKRRRKRGQGYARRFFSLDFTTNTLSYYHNRRTLSIRGAVPLSLAAVGTNAATREISIDSGAEVWHLKALNARDFENWRRALEMASQSSGIEASTGTMPMSMHRSSSWVPRDPEEERDWQRAEELISRLSVTRDLARRLARDMDPKYLPLATNFPGKSTGNLSGYASSSDPGSPGDPMGSDDYFGSGERRSFWKRKTSATKPSILSNVRKASSPAAPAPGGAYVEQRRPSAPGLQKLIAEEGLHEQSMEILRGLDQVIGDFSKLVADSKQRRMTVPNLVSSRLSVDSVDTQEFFDAEAGIEGSQLLTIQPDSESERSPEGDLTTDAEEEDSSASEIDEVLERSSILADDFTALFPTRTKTLDLSSFPPVKRRAQLAPPAQPPPSLIGFLRKNVGKDLSTVAMPVSANEPISLLQKMEETLEYTHLLDSAASTSLSPAERLLYVAAFAVSSLSSNRVKERAIRKPFNPMLGETFESIREDRGYRFLAEKVSHRPVQVAWHAESTRGWLIAQSPLPTQKFWGKSAELLVEGRIRLSLTTSGDHYSWAAPTCYLRNILAGEKYVEPVGSMSVKDERSGMHAHVEFAKAKGLFAGRSEGVSINLFADDGHAHPLPTGLVGKWTSSLIRCSVSASPQLSTSPASPQSPTSAPIWTVGDLVADAPAHYGFTVFAAGLNELLKRDASHLAPSDSRLRPDQRAAEDGDLQAAESFKGQLEEAQRERRRAMEADGEVWVPSWFAREERGGEEVWRLIRGEAGYWEARNHGNWKRAKSVFEL